jgi:hypothetical protein
MNDYQDDLPDFQKILSEVRSGEEKPKVVPTGSYRCRIVDHETGRSDKKLTPFIKFTLRLVEAEDSVDHEELEAMGGLGTGRSRRRTG